MTHRGLLVHLLVPHADGRRHLAAGPPASAALPSLEPALERGDTLVTGLQRMLRDAWRLDPVILETHLPPPPTEDAGYVGLAVLEAPPVAWEPAAVGLCWVDGVSQLPERIGPRAQTWLDEWAGRTAPPPLRPRWSRPGWSDRATRWIDSALAGRGRRGIGPVEMRRLWGISALALIPHDAGRVAWFKAVFPHFHHEPAVTRHLGRLVPGLVPPILATDVDEGWLLMEDAGAPLHDDDDAATLAAIDQLADAQEATRDRLDEFAALGVPRRPLVHLAEDLVAAMNEAEALGGEAVAPERLSVIASFVQERAAWLDALGMGEVLIHGDFHVGNLLTGSEGTRIIDWSDAAISHPVVDIGPWFGEVRPELRADGWESWLSAWDRFGPVDELRANDSDAYAISCAYQVVSYAGILRGLEPANRYQVADGFLGFWKDLEAFVPR
jgi:hypothetical protein